MISRGTVLGARGDQFWLPKSVRGDRLILAAKISPGDHFFAKIGPGGPLLGQWGDRFWCDRPKLLLLVLATPI